MQQDDSQHAPGQLAHRVALAPGLGAPDQPCAAGAHQQRDRQAKLNGQVQGQVMCVVQNVAKPDPGVQRDEVCVDQLAPAPAQPGLLPDQVQHIAPQGQPAAADRSAVAHACYRAAGARIEPVGQRQRVAGQCKGHQRGQCHQHHRAHRTGPGRSVTAAPALPPQCQQHDQHQLQQTGARRRGRIGRADQYPQQARQHPDRRPRFGAGGQPQQRCQADIEQGGKLVALAQIAKSLAGTGVVKPHAKSCRGTKIL
ncbi:hypothetical protein GALL_507710 [mine drainage metagenome]|uniref:Uncharacterized protein n=1 Tax=mine drainage metagenome TaxID=410659 RepID=A0A1J5P7T9_9ZZZZ